MTLAVDSTSTLLLVVLHSSFFHINASKKIIECSGGFRRKVERPMKRATMERELEARKPRMPEKALSAKAKPL